MIDERGVIIHRTGSAAIFAHEIADKLEEIARRMLVLHHNATREGAWSAENIAAFRTLATQRRNALNNLKKLGEQL